MKLLTALFIFAAISVTFAQITRTGKVKYTYPSTDEFRSDRDEEREKTVRINFGITFPAKPKVGAALNSFDLNYGEAGVKVEVAEIQRSYFILRIIAPEGASVNALGVSWIATNSANVNIAYFETEQAAQRALAASDYDALAVIAGFQFLESSDPKLEVNVGSVSETSVGFGITYNSDNEPNFISILVIHFKKTYGQKLDFESEEDDELYDGSGERHDLETEYIDQDNYRIFNAISGFDFVGRRGYRLTQTATLANVGSSTRVRYDFATASTTKIHQTQGQLLAIEA